jgi:hypothetical protein
MQPNLKALLCSLLLALACSLVFSACPPPVSNDLDPGPAATENPDDPAGEEDPGDPAEEDDSDDPVEEDDPDDPAGEEDPGDPSEEEDPDDPAEEGLPGLAGTSWEWGSTRLRFTTATRVRSGNTSYDYTYDRETRQGGITGLGDFSVDGDFLTLIFEDYMGSGKRVFENTDASLNGTVWRFGRALLEFGAAKARLHQMDYNYRYDAASRQGSLDASYGQPGPFTLSADGNTLTFSSYRGSPYAVSFVRDAGPDPAAGPLVGSDWWWTGTSLHLDFITDTEVLLWSFTGYYVPPIIFDYQHASGSGRIYNGRNEIGTKYDLGAFSITGDVLNFVQYGPYPHGAAFYHQE